MPNPKEAALPIHDMHERHPGLTEAISSAITEAAGVCMSRHHTSPQTFRIENAGKDSDAQVRWRAPDQRTLNAWANENDATEQGAYACVLAAVELVAGMVAIRRAETLTGADYFIAPIDASPQDLAQHTRLEVSGTANGTTRDVARRLARKVKQAREGRSTTPAIAGVVGFSARRIQISVRIES